MIAKITFAANADFSVIRTDGDPQGGELVVYSVGDTVDVPPHLVGAFTTLGLVE